MVFCVKIQGMKKGEENVRIQKKEEGFITLIIFFIIALALLKYFFNWSIFEASSTPQGQETVGYTRHLIDTIWFYMKSPVLWIIHHILEPLLGIVWDYFKEFVSWSQSHRS